MFRVRLFFLRTMENQVEAFEVQVPQARIVRIANADHYVFQTNEADVVRNIGSFISSLQPGGGALRQPTPLLFHNEPPMLRAARRRRI